MSTFSLKGNQKFDTVESIESQLADLKPGVVTVNLGGNSYGIDACKTIADKLEKIDTLEVANLDDMFTGRLREEIPESLDYLLTALLNCKKLHTINLSDNAFGIATIAPLEKFLSLHTPLQHLILANNGFGPEAGSRVGLALEKLAEKKQAEKCDTKLETVICGRNRLENGSMEAWAKFLKSHGSIKDLRLYQNGIRQEGIEHLMLHGLKFSPQLKTLDLQDNTFTLQGSAAMAKVVKEWPEINKISVSDCLLSAKGAELLVKELAKLDSLTNLEYLLLQYNEINETGLKLLLDAVKAKVPNLKLLELNGNNFSEDHEHVEGFKTLFNDRNMGELDELDDMELESDDEESEDEENDELEAGARDAEYAAAEPEAEENDKDADALTEKLAKLNT